MHNVSPPFAQLDFDLLLQNNLKWEKIHLESAGSVECFGDFHHFLPEGSPLPAVSVCPSYSSDLDLVSGGGRGGAGGKFKFWRSRAMFRFRPGDLVYVADDKYANVIEYLNNKEGWKRH